MNRVWVCPVTDGALPDFGAAFRAHMAKKTCGEARRASRAAWRLLAAALEAARISPLPTVAFEPMGKPVFTDCGLHFSLSHSGSMAAVMLSEGPCGVDIERIRPEVAERLWDRCASPEEAEAGLDFWDVWTMKESLGKLSGQGIGIRPREINTLEPRYRRYARAMRTLRGGDGEMYRLCAVSEGQTEIEMPETV